MLLSPIGPEPTRNRNPTRNRRLGASRRPGSSIHSHASCCYHRPGPSAPLCLPFRGGFSAVCAEKTRRSWEMRRSNRLDCWAVAGQRKGTRTGPSDRKPARRPRAQPPLSTGRPGPVPSPTPVQPVPRSSPSRRTGPEAAGCPSLRPDAVRGGQPSPASQPRAELWAEIYRASKRCQPSKSLLYVCIVPPDRRKSPKVITERSQMRDRGQQPSQWRWPRPEAPRARPRPRARAPDRPGRPPWPRR